MQSSYSRIKIVIIDDDAQDVILMKNAFRDLNIGSHVTHLSERSNMIEYISSLRQPNSIFPNLIFLDLDMPKISGIEILDILKIDEKLRLIPIIVMSHSNIPETIKLCYSKHANSYIIKPPSYAELKSIMKCVFEYWFNCISSYIPGYDLLE